MGASTTGLIIDKYLYTDYFLYSMKADFSDIWRIFYKGAIPGRTWHWWWWLFFFENERNPDKPLQLMVLWANKNAKKTLINGFKWNPKLPIVEKQGGYTFESVVASWFYDGKKVREPFILESGPTATKYSHDQGSISMKNEKGEYSYGGKDSDFYLRVENPDVSIDLRMTRWTDEMAKLIPTGKTFIGGKMGYSMLKYRGLNSSGWLRYNGSIVDVRGRAYFQKVRIYSLTPCWYWGLIQWDNGSYLQYFLPHAGLPMLRQAYPHSTSWDWGFKILSRTMNFYDAEKGKEYLLKDVTISKRYENDLPVMKVTGRGSALGAHEGSDYTTGSVNDNKKEVEINVETVAYGRCCWDISQPFVPPFWLGIFYNEYPAKVTNFSFRAPDRTISMGDMGRSYCNIEHSWGTI